MKKHEKTIKHFRNLLNEDYSKGSLLITQYYFEDNIGLGEMNMNLVMLRGHWYVADTDSMTLQRVEDFVDCLLEIASKNDFIIDWLEEFYDNKLNKTIKDLFLEQKSYIVTYDLGNDYYVWIETLSENGNTITSHKFDERMLENNLIIELHSEKFDDAIAEWDCCSDLDLNSSLDFLIETMKYAIEEYENEE